MTVRVFAFIDPSCKIYLIPNQSVEKFSTLLDNSNLFCNLKKN